MLKNLLAIITLAALLSSCGPGDGEKKKETAADETLAAIEFATLIETPEKYLDKEISLEGKVVHICKHSGKKMFIVGENPDIRLHISAGDEVPKFPLDMEGSTILVSGRLGKIVAAAPKTEGEEQKEEGEAKVEKMTDITADEDCATEVAVAEQPVLSDFVLHYSAHKVTAEAEVTEEEVTEEEVKEEK